MQRGVEILLVVLCYRKRDKLWPFVPLGSYADFIFSLPYQNPVTVKPDQQSSSNMASGDSGTYAAPISGDYMPLHPSVRSWEINRELVEIVKFVGKGAFSQVAKATAWSICDNEECTTVAVKMLKGTATNCELSRFMNNITYPVILVWYCL